MKDICKKKFAKDECAICSIILYDKAPNGILIDLDYFRKSKNVGWLQEKIDLFVKEKEEKEI